MWQSHLIMQIFVCVPSQIHIGIIILFFSFFLLWVLFLNGLGLEGQITHFQCYFPFRILKDSHAVWSLGFFHSSLRSNIQLLLLEGKSGLLCCWPRSSSGEYIGFLEQTQLIMAFPQDFLSPIVNIFDYHGAFEQLISVPDYWIHSRLDLDFARLSH